MADDGTNHRSARVTTPESNLDSAAEISRLQQELDNLRRELGAIPVAEPRTSAKARLGVNLVPGAAHPYVDVPFAGAGVEGVEAQLRDIIAPDHWLAFKRLFDEFRYSLSCAEKAVDLLADAISADDFKRWTPKARKELDVTSARFAMVEPDLDRSGLTYAKDVRSRLSALEERFAQHAGNAGPGVPTLFITGEYER